MKNKLTVIFAALMLLFCLTSCSGKDANAKDSENANGEIEQTEEKRETKYSTADELAEEFMNVCKDGDVEKMYGLYYDDMLSDTYERVKDKLSKEDFDSLLADEMKTISDYAVFEYGSDDLPATVSPLYYVNYMHYGMTGSDTELTEQQLTNCAVLRVFKPDNSQSDHMLAEIDGSWYVIE